MLFSTSEAAALRAPIGKRLEAMVLERSDSVLWSLSPKGIILHNLTTGKYLELDSTGYRLWALMDGARCIRDVLSACDSQCTDAGQPATTPKMRKIVALLTEHNFVRERVADEHRPDGGSRS